MLFYRKTSIFVPYIHQSTLLVFTTNALIRLVENECIPKLTNQINALVVTITKLFDKVYGMNQGVLRLAHFFKKDLP